MNAIYSALEHAAIFEVSPQNTRLRHKDNTGWIAGNIGDILDILANILSIHQAHLAQASRQHSYDVNFTTLRISGGHHQLKE